MGTLRKSKGGRARVKGGKHAGVEGTIISNPHLLSTKQKVRTSDGNVIKVKRRKLARRFG